MQRLIYCSDGTWNKPDQEDRDQVAPSNVYKISQAIVEQDPQGNKQQSFYDTGVGTHWYDRFRGGTFGIGLSANVKQGYRFLSERFEDGDEIFLFGFSRGAFTVRSLAGLIRNSGLLRPDCLGKLEDAYDLYKRRDPDAHPDADAAKEFRRLYSREIRIKFIGVWDTVGALGIPLDRGRWINAFNRNWQFHDVKLSRSVDYAYQALAIDEVREPFKPSLWEQQENCGNQVMEQAWFAGVHSNIGGGYVDTGLSDLALQWIADKAKSCGLELKNNWLTENCHPNPLGELRNSKVGFYRLDKDYHRPVCSGSRSNEAIHPSVLERSEKMVPRYNPTNFIGKPS